MGVQDVLMLEVSPQGLSHRGRAHLTAQLSAPPCLQIGILRGYLESQGPMKTGKMATHNSGLCAVLYSKIFKQVRGQGWPRQQGRVPVTGPGPRPLHVPESAFKQQSAHAALWKSLVPPLVVAVVSPKCRPKVA